MTTEPISDASFSTQAIHEFLATYDGLDADDRWIATLICERLHRDRYRRERTHREWFDLGGEA